MSGDMASNISVYFVANYSANSSVANHNETDPMMDAISKEFKLMFKYIVVGWIASMIGVFGLIGNILSALILVRPSMRSSLNIILLGLTMWDILMIITTLIIMAIPTILQYEEVENVVTNVWIPLSTPWIYAVRSTAQLGSAVFTLLVTLERYIAVCKPLHTRTICTERRAVEASFLTTTFITLYSLPRWWDFEVMKIPSKDETLENKYEVISTNFRDNPTYKMFYLRWGFFIINCAIPFILLSFMNWAICRGVARFNKTRKALVTTTSTESKEISLTKMLICIVTVSLLVTGLIFALTIIDTFWTSELSDYLWWVAKPLVVFNSSVNCLFYCIFGKAFRGEFKKLFIPRRFRGDYSVRTPATSSSNDHDHSHGKHICVCRPPSPSKNLSQTKHSLSSGRQK